MTVDGKRVEMSPKEYELLFYLVRNRNMHLTVKTDHRGMGV